MKHATRIAQTKAWIEQLVIGMNLCPFASVPFRKGQIRYRVVDAGLQAEEWVSLLLAEGRMLLDPGQTEPIETTLLILPEGWSDFVAYLDLVGVLEQVIADAGWVGDIQLATFHPEYQFAGSAPDDPANYTNRSPYPMLHLLREDRLSEALANYPHPERIPEVNMQQMRKRGKAQLEQLLNEIKKLDT